MNAQISEELSAELDSSGVVNIRIWNEYEELQSEVSLTKDEVSKLRIALEAFERKQNEQ